MKFLKLDLRAFGPFTDRCLDLSQAPQGLQLIYGPNEAGKSSALRAISDLLFEIPSRTSDNFIHAYPKLRIGAELEGSNRNQLEFIRRKGKQNTLRCGDDQNLVEEATLQAFLGNVDRGLFELMFGIDHQRLREGGTQILEGKGEIGQLLFAAGAGIANLQEVQSSLGEEIDQLLKPSGRSGDIATSINDLRALEKATKESQVSLESWRKHDEVLQVARKQKERCDQAQREKQTELNRLSRITTAIPLAGHWKQARADWEPVRNAPLLDRSFSETSSQTIIDLKTAEQQKVDLEENREKVREKLKQAVIPENIIQEATAIEAARNDLGSYLKAKADLPGLMTERTIAENDAKDLLQKLGRPPELSEIESLRLTSDKTVLIQSLGNQKEGLVERQRSTQGNCERFTTESSLKEVKLQEIQAVPDYHPLQQKLKSIQQQGDLETLLQSWQNELQELQQEADVRLQQLPLWSGTLTELELIAIPSPTTIDQFAEEFQENARQTRTLQQQLQQLHQDQEALDTRLEQLELAQNVPTNEELTQKRQLREQGWQLVLKAWQQNEEDTAAHAEFLNQFPDDDRLADAYHQSVGGADQVADQLRSDADRVATKAQLLKEHAQNLTREAALLAEVTDQDQVQQTNEQRWREVWSTLQIEPRSPVEMREWLREQGECRQLGKDIRLKRSAIEQQERQIETAHSELSASFAELEPGLKFDQKSLKDLLNLAEDRCQHYQKSENQREQYQEELESLQKELADSESQARQAQSNLADWQSDWETAVREIGLTADALPAQANQVLTDIGALMSKSQQADQVHIRIEDIEREAQEFASRTTDLIKRIYPALATRPLSEAVNQLDSELKAARATQEKQTDLIKQEKELEDKWELAHNTISRLSAALAEMCRQASCESHELLPQAYEQSQNRQQLESNIQNLKEQILLHSSGVKFEDFLTEVELEAREADSLSPRMEELTGELDQLSQERDELIRQIERETSELAKIDGSALAAEKAAECESITAHLEEQVHKYAVLKVASAMLNEGIDQYRQKNEGPVLKRASEIFREITLKAYQGLQVDFDDRAKPILTGVRNKDELIQVTQMSDGTCDQLYLALRLASLETWLQHHEPLPFIVDDILLNFDDDRAIASLKVLSELAQQTQVLFFTHHAHLVKIAEEHLSDQNLKVTNLHDLK